MKEEGDGRIEENILRLKEEMKKKTKEIKKTQKNGTRDGMKDEMVQGIKV